MLTLLHRSTSEKAMLLILDCISPSFCMEMAKIPTGMTWKESNGCDSKNCTDPMLLARNR
jgi:hypothetical protein